MSSLLARRLRGVIVVTVLCSGLAVAHGGAAHADDVYLFCPMPVAGAACGFEGTVSEGPVTVIFRFATTRGYGSEKQEHTCSQPTCWIGQHAVGAPDRTPAGFEVRTRGAFVSWREYS